MNLHSIWGKTQQNPPFISMYEYYDPCVDEDVKVPSDPSLDHLLPTTCEELKKTIMKSNSKSCGLDPIPTSLLKKCLDSLLLIHVRMVNLSFTSSTFPNVLKLAMVIPLLKQNCF